MKAAPLSLLLVASFALCARADLTIVQNVEGAGPTTSMTIRLKGDKARVDAGPQISTIIDSKSGEILNIMREQKKYMRISGAQAKAAAAMALGGDNEKAGKPTLQPTGKKETINGYEAEEYISQSPAFTASYWITRDYPNAAEILKQMQAMTPESWGATAKGMPDYRDFPGLPLRSQMKMAGQEITSTLQSVKLDPLPDADFAVPAGFTEMKIPGMDALLGGGKPGAAPKAAASPKSR